MRRMYSEKQILELVKNNPEAVVNALLGQDINVNGITSKGIANTGNIANTGDIGASGKITGGEIIENMSGYGFTPSSHTDVTFDFKYAGVVKNGNKITLSVFTGITVASGVQNFRSIGVFTIPSSVGAKIFPYTLGTLDNVVDSKKLFCLASNFNTGNDIYLYMTKNVNNQSMTLNMSNASSLSAGVTYLLRFEVTFLLSENLVPEE